jgi:hypothetical protein
VFVCTFLEGKYRNLLSLLKPGTQGENKKEITATSTNSMCKKSSYSGDKDFSFL